VTLIDGANMERYFPQEYTNGDCFCSSWEGQRHLEPGDTIEAWVVYPAPPEDVESVTVELGIAPSLIDVPIGESAELREPEGELDEPIILDIVALSDGLDDGTGRSESGDETAIMLSTDVLFDVNESTLTDEAERILEEAAAEIDAASGDLIQIDGHADNTGTDAINDPLSLDRAEAVQERLEDLITRSGVEYEAEGHGSHDPIADNSTEDGREKNRRVTVTFTP
jgi:outer membrane protein OmpA-like peptidoglycan-associated protein